MSSKTGRILQSLRLPSDCSITTAYLVGSRLWGTVTPTSDYDLLIVVSDPPTTVRSKAELLKSQHSGNYDVTLLYESEFREKVEEGSLIETICCLLDSDDGSIVYAPEPNPHSARRQLIYATHLATLRSWADARALRDLEKAAKFWGKGGSARVNGWKILHHSLAAEAILRGLAEDIASCGSLRDVRLTTERIQGMVAAGRRDEEQGWLGLDWEAVLGAYRKWLAEVAL
ncbi:hypothetical protein MKEN_00499600 [Mycena kentingensis (nom. inval.)]|nr:hypothetical protein MKEN_00499600 [Mycena kentingensis (nom. inval.)]